MRVLILALLGAAAAASQSPAALLGRLSESTAAVEMYCLEDFQQICAKHKSKESSPPPPPPPPPSREVDDMPHRKEMGNFVHAVHAGRGGKRKLRRSRADRRRRHLQSLEETQAVMDGDWSSMPDEASETWEDPVDVTEEEGVADPELIEDLVMDSEDEDWGEDGPRPPFSIVLLVRQFLPWTVSGTPEPCDMDMDMDTDMGMDEGYFGYPIEDGAGQYDEDIATNPEGFEEYLLDSSDQSPKWVADPLEPEDANTIHLGWVKIDQVDDEPAIETLDDYMCLYNHMDKIEYDSCYEALVLAKEDYEECIDNGLFLPPHGHGDAEDFLIVLLVASVVIAFVTVRYRNLRAKQAIETLVKSSGKGAGNAYAVASEAKVEEEKSGLWQFCRFFGIMLASIFVTFTVIGIVGHAIAHIHHHHDDEGDEDEEHHHHHAHPVFLGLFLFCGSILMVLGTRLLLWPQACSRSQESEEEGYPGTSHYMRIEEQTLEKEQSLPSKTVTAELVDQDERC